MATFASEEDSVASASIVHVTVDEAHAIDPSHPPDASSPRYLIRNVKSRKFLDATVAPSTSESPAIYLFPRNGQSSQEWILQQGNILNPSTQRLLAVDWDESRQTYNRGLAWTTVDTVRDPSDVTWDFTAEGTISHRATGQVLGLGFSMWGLQLWLYRHSIHNEFQQWQLIPVSLVK